MRYGLTAGRMLTAAFLAALCWNPAAVRAATAPQAYAIGPGDQLDVQVVGDASLSQKVTVLPDGSISYPLVGAIRVGGETPGQAAQSLAQRLATYVRHPDVTVAVVQAAQPTVMVLGDVKAPGKFVLRAGAHLSDALAAAGGLGATNGVFPDARISSADGQVRTVSLQRLLQDGDVALDLAVGDGSVVYVPGANTFNVDVMGAVDHPGEISLDAGDRLSVAIAKAGDSVNSRADLSHIFVTRQTPTGKKTYQVDLYKALQGANSAYDIQLQKGDVVYVPQAGYQRAGLLYGLLWVIQRAVLHI